VTQEEYRGLVRSCREQIRKAKAQLELRLDTVVRDKKNVLTNTSTTERGSRRISIPYWMPGGNIANKDEEQADVLNAFFASVLNNQTVYSQGSQPPVLEAREEEQNKPPII